MPKGNHNAKGRPPSLAPRTQYVTVKLSEAEKARLEEAARLLNATKTQIVVNGIDTIHAQAIAAENKRRKEAGSTGGKLPAIERAKISFGDFSPSMDALQARAQEIEKADKKKEAD